MLHSQTILSSSSVVDYLCFNIFAYTLMTGCKHNISLETGEFQSRLDEDPNYCSTDVVSTTATNHPNRMMGRRNQPFVQDILETTLTQPDICATAELAGRLYGVPVPPKLPDISIRSSLPFSSYWAAKLIITTFYTLHDC
jgi:hypothetical protein